VKPSTEEVARSPEGNWPDDQLLELQQAMDEYDFRQEQLAECDRKRQAYLGKLPTRPTPVTQPSGTAPPQASGKKNKAKNTKAETLPNPLIWLQR
jgi:hypothetical protein